MQTKINDCVIEIATVNGSGSQSANNIIQKTIFRMGIPVGGKNLFPSNIAGLPTWYTIRINDKGYTGRRLEVDIVVAMNPQTIQKDIQKVRPGGFFFHNADLKIPENLLRKDVTNISIPFRQIVDSVTTAIKLKKLLTNMVYVGVIAELMNFEDESLHSALSDQFKGKASAVESNMKALAAGREYAKQNLSKDFPFKVKKANANTGKILIEGNTAAAIGLMFGGCSFAAWYPITPSSSLVENFMRYANEFRKDASGKNTYAVVQAEDELASIAMVAGAGWAGARAMTATSGPGLSLMAEAAGLCYYAEIPAVIWDIQRTGPSTGLPTRTQQSDLSLAYHLSHGDTEHIILLPGTVKECFEFGQTCFDLAEQFQTMVIVLSDLDLGMNFWSCDEFKYPSTPINRGKVLTAEQLQKTSNFARYKDVDGDGIPYRTLPGTRHDKAAFLTRGSGHNEMAQYTEDSEQYKVVIERLRRKFNTAKTFIPQPIIDNTKNTVGIIAFGSSDGPMFETRDLLKEQGVNTDYLRIRALPFTDSIAEFIKQHERVYVVEQNRDGQMFQLLRSQWPETHAQLRSIRHYDGLPIHAGFISSNILQQEKAQ